LFCHVKWTSVRLIYLRSVAESAADKPSPPRNLATTTITAETADLQWETPEDDGGSPVTHYVVEKRDVQKKAWQEVGKASDLTTHVENLRDQTQYLFRVSAANEFGVSDPVELNEPVTAKNPFSELFVINPLISSLPSAQTQNCMWH